ATSLPIGEYALLTNNGYTYVQWFFRLVLTTLKGEAIGCGSVGCLPHRRRVVQPESRGSERQGVFHARRARIRALACHRKPWRKPMFRLIAVSAFILSLATSL